MLRHYCRINIVGTVKFFGFNLSENPASNCVLFINESVVKLSEQRAKFLLTQSGSKNSSLFPNVGIRRKAMQKLFYTTWHCTASCSIFIISIVAGAKQAVI